MAPSSLSATNVSSQYAQVSTIPQPLLFQGTTSSQPQWQPDSIGTVAFGVVMFLLGIIAVWQGRQRRIACKLDEEQGDANDGNRTVDAVSGLQMVDLAENIGVEKAGGGMAEQSGDGSKGDEMVVVRVCEGVRTDTGITLVGDDIVETEAKDEKAED